MKAYAADKPKGAAVQKTPMTTLVTQTAPIATDTHGGRAKCLQRLVRLDLPVPRTVALPFNAVHKIAGGDMPDLQAVADEFPRGALLCVRPSSQDPDWGGPGAVLNIGMNDARFMEYCERMGEGPASALYTRFVQSYAVNVARLDPDMFDEVIGDGREALEQSLRAYELETEEAFPQDPRDPVDSGAAVRWPAHGKARRRVCCVRQKGAPADAGLGLIVQEMAFGVGHGALRVGRVATGRQRQRFAANYRPLPKPVTGARRAARRCRRDVSDPRSARPVAGRTRPRGIRDAETACGLDAR